MKVNRILTVATLAAAGTFTPKLIAGDCAASKSASASTCTAGKNIVAVAAGAENFRTLVAAVVDHAKVIKTDCSPRTESFTSSIR